MKVALVFAGSARWIGLAVLLELLRFFKFATKFVYVGTCMCIRLGKNLTEQHRTDSLHMDVRRKTY